MSPFSPKVVVFSCKWCQRGGTDICDIAKGCGIPSVKIIESMCSGAISPTHILRAFKSGADGVFIIGCPVGDCHYQSGNYKARRRVKLMKIVIDQLGIEPERLGIALLSEAEMAKFKAVLRKFADGVTKLGPLGGAAKAGTN